MNLKNKVVFIVVFLLISFSVGFSILHYFKFLEDTQLKLKEDILPLSVDSIYTEVQKKLIKPILISSLISNNTFLIDWLIKEEEQVDKISKYFETIKNKYNIYDIFLISDKTKNYYTQKGLLEKLKEDNPNNMWYFEFKKKQEMYEINFDFNTHISQSLMMFINYKIFDNNSKYLGLTGIVVESLQISEVLKYFRLKYDFNVFFVNNEGAVVFSEVDKNKISHLKENKELNILSSDILEKTTKILEYKKDGKKYILITEYIEELDLYLLIEVQVKKFTQEIRKTFAYNLIISLLVTLMIIAIIIYAIKKYSKKLEHLARYDSLTQLQNRGTINLHFEKELDLYKRDQIPRSVIFFDLDNFKDVNDNYGHLVGDMVLKRVAAILNNQTRSSDNTSRWGGEEFLILLHNSSLENSYNVAEKLRMVFESDIEMHKLIKGGMTVSFGVTEFSPNDTVYQIVSRADEALYKAKSNGKNCVVKG